MPPVVFLFSGQGSQYHQMGRELFARDETFRSWMLRGDALVAEWIGRSVIGAIYDDTSPRGRPFDDILLSHPSIFLVEYAMARRLLDAGIRPAILVASSVGIFAAWAVAGCLPFEQCLEAVVHQANVVAATCAPGGMLAVLGSPRLYHSDPALYRQCELAGINFDRHFVVSGRPEDLDQVARHLRSLCIPSQRLPVRYAFHSHYVEPAADLYRRYLGRHPEPAAAFPIVTTIPRPTDRHTLWHAVREPTDFQSSMQTLESSPHCYIDIGPAGTLATFVKYNLPPTSPSLALPTLTPFGNDLANLAHILDQLT